VTSSPPAGDLKLSSVANSDEGKISNFGGKISLLVVKREDRVVEFGAIVV